MRDRFFVVLIPTIAVFAVILLTPTRIKPDGLTGCMGMAMEMDLHFHDVWHGGENGPPSLHPDCDFIDDECEFGDVFEDSNRENYHAGWVEGILGEGHSLSYPPNWACFGSGAN